MATMLTRSLLDPVREKVAAGERLDFDDGVALLESDDLLAVGELANTARRMQQGNDEVYFVNNLYLNHTNVCRVKCKFCAFARTNKQGGAHTWDIGDLVEHAVEVHGRNGYQEIHMVGGESPHLDFDYYLDLIRSLKAALPDGLEHLAELSVTLLSVVIHYPVKLPADVNDLLLSQSCVKLANHHFLSPI